MLKKTESFVSYYYNDINYELIKHMEILSGTTSYPMKIEYLLQLLLQNFCQKNKQNNFNEYKYFENESNTERILKVKINEEFYKNETLIKALNDLEAKFNEWIICLITLYDLDFLKNKITFPLFCHGISEVIQILIEPDLIQASGTSDRNKGSNKPKYSLPTETLYVSYYY